MNLDLLFKLIFLGVFLSFAGVMSYYRRRAEQASGNWRERIKEHNEHEMKELVILRTVLGVPFYLGLVIWLVAPLWMTWSALPLPIWARWLGVLLGGLAVALNIWAHQTLSAKLGMAFNPVLRLNTVPALVTEGPYRWVRHPIYLAFLLMMVATSLLTSNWLLGGCGLGLILCVIGLRTSEEERRLIEQFGDQYRQYMRRTGGYLPRMSA
jgi:protein-S-isoprenylcysteine O-methyltransferase Ste14